MNLDLATKYRPLNFNDLIGQDNTVSSLKSMIDREKKLPPAVLFYGPSGVGKTTLARIIAKYVGCVEQNLLELNASNKNSVEDMRDLIDLVSYNTLGSNKVRVIILDEAHQLSKSAWNSLLKPIEEPGSHTSWVFCSTEPHKIPEAIKTRCVAFELKGVNPVKIKAMLDKVVKAEEFTTPNNIINAAALAAKMSPRAALKNLEKVFNETDLEKAKEILKSVEQEELAVVQVLGRLIMSNGSFLAALGAIRGAQDEVEGIRLGLVKYFTTVCIRSDNIAKCKQALYVIDAFSRPYNPSEGKAPLLLSLAQVLIAD